MLWFVVSLAFSALLLYVVASVGLKIATHYINRHRAATAGDSPPSSQTTLQ